jgi:hypothetical protein
VPITQTIWKNIEMSDKDTAVALYADHAAADTAVKELVNAGFSIKSLSVVGKGYHTDEHATGFYNMGDRVRFWGSRGAMWGGLWGLFFGGLFLTIPVVGHVVVLGYLAATAISAVESAVVVGGVSAIGAALIGMGIPKDSVVTYETALKADNFLVMAHGTADDVARAKAVLAKFGPVSIDIHTAAMAGEPAMAHA